jgi:hypothetical protein
MPMLELAIDNDALIKLTWYGLTRDLLHHCCGSECRKAVGMLSAGRWVGKARLAVAVAGGSAPATVLDDFDALVAELEALEPTPAELELAASFEEGARVHNQQLDAGESQLAAIVIERSGVLLTGDKRAITSFEALLDQIRELERLAGKVACLEQALMSLIHHLSPDTVRSAVCRAPEADVAMRLAFECGRGLIDDFAPLGLVSYVTAVRRSAPRVIVQQDSLCDRSVLIP